MNALRNFADAVAETVGAARNGWHVFTTTRRAWRTVRKEHNAAQASRPATEYVTLAQHAACGTALQIQISQTATEQDERIDDLQRQVERLSSWVADRLGADREQKPFRPEPVRRTYFCPNGHNVFTTTETNPECAACGAVMTTDQDAFEAACEASDIRRYGPL